VPIPPVVVLHMYMMNTQGQANNRVRNWSFLRTTDYFDENILFREVHSNMHELYIKRTSVNSDG